MSVPRAPRLTILLLLGVALLATGAAADPPTHCPAETDLLDKHGYLRALSMDLRGEAPSLDEHEALESQDDVTLAHINEWLDSPSFAQQLARFHRNLLWNRVNQVRLTRNDNYLIDSHHQVDDVPGWYSPQRAMLIRGVSAIPCADTPAQYDPVTSALQFTLDPATGAMREGWVMVAPYWDPANPVKVCAADASTALLASDGTDCKSLDGLSRAGCGCGPNLNWCVTGPVESAMRRSLGDAVDRRIEQMILDNEPYTNLFLDNTSFVNGPLVHYWRHVAQRYDIMYMDPLPISVDTLPDLPMPETDTWVPIELPPYHSGVLTSPAYLFRHTSYRRRGMRFYEALVCQPFQSPAGGLKFEESGLPDPDLKLQDGCKFCHSILEPASEHWGRWSEFGAAYLSPETHPPCRADCQTCATTGNCNTDCRRNYVTIGAVTKELAFLGWLKPYQFTVDPTLMDAIKTEEVNTSVQCASDLVSQAKVDHIEMGPKLIVKQTIFDGRLASCAAKNMFQWLIGREPGPAEADWIAELATAFDAAGYDLKTLIRAVVVHENYRRVQ
jgi:hypothetical protein